MDEISNYITKWEEIFSLWVKFTVKTATETTDAGITRIFFRSKSLVHSDTDIAEITQIILDIFTEDKKAVFDVNLEVFGIKKFLEMLCYVSADSETLYHTLVSDLKRQLKSGELNVRFT